MFSDEEDKQMEEMVDQYNKDNIGIGMNPMTEEVKERSRQLIKRIGIAEAKIKFRQQFEFTRGFRAIYFAEHPEDPNAPWNKK